MDDVKKLHTVEDIARDIIATSDPEFIDHFKAGTLHRARYSHVSLYMWVRNHYGLWYDSPLTHIWRTYPETHDIRDGIDYSQDHPDAVSDAIITAVWNLLQK